jgi:hypothetical protein
MPLPDTYSELYPGRFLKADMFKGKKVTLTIKNIDIEELVGENNKKDPKVIVSFVERALEYVMPKTNGFCLKRMFGDNPHSWIGKRVVWYPTKTKFGREDVDCIRIWGSPDLDEDMEITVPQGRKKRLEMVMHAVRSNGHQPAAANVPDPRIVAAWGVLDWTEAERNEDRAKFTGSDGEYVARLNGLIDKMNDAA